MAEATAAKVAGSDRYVLLDGMRGLAALSIVVHHFTADSGHTELFASASIAVDFFFCLSGFVIAHAYHDRLVQGMTLGDYATKRLVRLYPMYLLGTLLGLGGVLLLKAHGLTNLTSEAITKAAALNLLYLPYFNSYYVEVFEFHLAGALFPLNNPGWSLFFGVLANLIYATTVRTTRAGPGIWLAFAAVGLCIATAAYGEAPGWGTDNFLGGFPRVLFSFFAGVVVYQVHDKTRALPRVKAAWLVAFVILLVAMPRFSGHKLYWLAMVLGVVPFVVAMASWCEIKPNSLARRACLYSGRLSYPVFCVHYPVLMFFSIFPTTAVHHFIVVAVGFFATTLMVAHLVMTYVEEPMREWLSARLAPT